MAKPVGARCNLACRYCYYLEKARLYGNEGIESMDDGLLELYIKSYIESQTTDDVLFTWHGGEPLLKPRAFYEKALRLQQQYARGRMVSNSIQTNGTLLDDSWCEFFKTNGWLVGVSIDGPSVFHDEYRQNRHGEASFQRVMNGISRLNRYGVEWNALAVVNDFNADYPLEFYRFFRDIGCRYLQFTPVVERWKPHLDGQRLASADDDDGESVTPFSVGPRQWGSFLCRMFDEWVRKDVGQMFVQLFDATLAGWLGEAPGLCTLARDCGHAMVMEHNGDVYSCDHFVFPEFKLGNIRSQTLVEMASEDRQKAFARRKQEGLTRQCRQCRFLFACHGECPKNRFLKVEGESNRQNYLCEGYYEYFRHVAPYMDFMAGEFRHRRAPANVMQAIARGLL